MTCPGGQGSFHLFYRTTLVGMSCPIRSIGGGKMKLAFFLKNKLTRQKSLKQYAWYQWY